MHDGTLDFDDEQLGSFDIVLASCMIRAATTARDSRSATFRPSSILS